MSKVIVNTAQNRLNITMTGSISKEEMENLYADVLTCVPQLKPGFNVLNDISNCKIIHLDSAPTFQRIMEFLINKNIGKIVRVVKTKTTFNQLSRITENMKGGYMPIYLSTFEESEQFLSEPD